MNNKTQASHLRKREYALRAIFTYCELPMSSVQSGFRDLDRDERSGTDFFQREFQKRE